MIRRANPLYSFVPGPLEAFLAIQGGGERPVPRFVERELRVFRFSTHTTCARDQNLCGDVACQCKAKKKSDGDIVSCAFKQQLIHRKRH
jgi:hypothetical protein